MTSSENEWTPGDPLFDRYQNANSQYLFNYREEPVGPVCNCGDAARWPIPSSAHWELGMDDELERFIKETHKFMEGEL